MRNLAKRRSGVSSVSLVVRILISFLYFSFSPPLLSLRLPFNFGVSDRLVRYYGILGLRLDTPEEL